MAILCVGLDELLGIWMDDGRGKAAVVWVDVVPGRAAVSWRRRLPWGRCRLGPLDRVVLAPDC